MLTHANIVSSTLGPVASANSCLVSTLWGAMVKLLFWVRVRVRVTRVRVTLGLASYDMHYIERCDSSPVPG